MRNTMDAKKAAFWYVIVGAGVGVIGSLLFYGQPLGLSFALFISVIIAAVLYTARVTGSPVNRRNLWPLLPALGFALMVAVRADPTITLLNITAALLLGALALAYLTVPDALDTAPLSEQSAGVMAATAITTVGAVAEVPAAWAYIRATSRGERRALVAVLRGALITAPVVLVFGALLSDADAAFAGLVGDLAARLNLAGLEALIEQGVMALALAWLTVGGLTFGLRRTGREPVDVPPATEPAADADADPALQAALAAGRRAAPTKRKPFIIQLGLIEAGMLLAAVAGLFGVFVLMQFQYFFGGDANISVGGFTYAEYARRGFFELLTVSQLTLGLLLALDRVTIRRERREQIVFRGLALAIVALIGVMIASASQRMTLYEMQYGFTHQRVYAHVLIWWIAVLFGVFVLAMLRVRRNIFSLGVLLVLIGYLATLNVLNVDLYIAERNIARYEAGLPLDLCYLRSLSVDALPAMLALADHAADMPSANADAVRQHVLWWLVVRRGMHPYRAAEPTLGGLHLAHLHAHTALLAQAEAINASAGWVPCDRW